MVEPLVSVIIPAYNAEAFLERTLQSVLTQSHTQIEVVVIDDGSKDRTPDIVRAIAQHDSRLRLLQQPNIGVAAARNTGIRATQGEFIAPIDADDVWYPNTLEKLLTRFQKGSPDVGVVYTWSWDIDECDHLIGGFHAARVEGNVYKTLICHNFLGNASCTLIRRACLEQVGGYDPRFKAQNAQGCEDWDLYLRLAERCQFAVVPQFLVGYRKLTMSMSGDFEQMARSQHFMLHAIQENHPEFPAFLYRISRSSFYLYFAHQCDHQSDSSAALFWLREAVKADAFVSLGRLSIYLLAIKHSFKRPLACSKSAACLASIPSRPSKIIPLNVLNTFSIQLKVFVGSLLHQFLLRT